MAATQTQRNMIGSGRGDGLTENKPDRTVYVSGTTTEAPPFSGPGVAAPRVRAAQASPLDLPITVGAGLADTQDRTPVLLPQSLYRSIDGRYWLLAILGGILAWWALFHLL